MLGFVTNIKSKTDTLNNKNLSDVSGGLKYSSWTLKYSCILDRSNCIIVLYNEALGDPRKDINKDVRASMNITSLMLTNFTKFLPLVKTIR